jgi:hypothetical protein
MNSSVSLTKERQIEACIMQFIYTQGNELFGNLLQIDDTTYRGLVVDGNNTMLLAEFKIKNTNPGDL